MVGHLRPVKDPFRAGVAARRLPPASRVRVLHIGGAMSEAMAARARGEMEKNRRYVWLGEQPRWRARRLLARSCLLVLPSHMEGGANVLSEAIAAGVPALASRIPGSVGLLGADYPGYFEVGDTRGLAELMLRAERDSAYYKDLKRRINKLAPLFDPARERAAWADLLAELSGE